MRAMNDLLDEMASHYSKLLQGKSRITIGLSGGVDSVVLLYLLSKMRMTVAIQLEAVHINHGISANASKWERFCIDLCASLDVKLLVFSHTIRKGGGESLENNARQARYKDFSSLDCDIIALAHHQNDQIETMLSQLLRGSDLHNIAAMPYLYSKFGKLFWRPLLNVRRFEIELFARQAILSHIEDESNDNKIFLRNFVRHSLLPELIKWDKNVLNKLCRVTKQMQDIANLLDEVGHEDLQNCMLSEDEFSLILVFFKQLSIKRQINLLNCYIRKNNLPLPSQNQVKEFCRQAATAAWDKRPELKINEDYFLLKCKDKIKLITKVNKLISE